MANVLSKPSTKAHIGYNGFNLSHRLKFSSTFGELLPVFHDLAKPGDKYSLGYRLLTRTEHLNKPAWLSCTEKIDWFFVPLTQLYQFFPEFYYGTQDVKTSLMDPDNVLVGKIPALANTQLERSNFLAALTTSVDIYNSNLVGTGVRVAELLGFPIPDFQVTSASDMDRSPHPLFPCAYQKIFMDYYRDTDREPNVPSYYNLDYYGDTGQGNGSIPGVTFADYFKLRYHRIKPDLFTHTFTSPLYSSQSSQLVDPASGYAVGFVNQLEKALSNWLLPQESIANNTSVDLGNLSLGPSGHIDNYTPSALSGRVAPGLWSNATAASYYHVARQVAAATSPQSLRHSFALEKLLEVTRRAGKHYDAQTLAHFGVEVPTGIAGEVMFIGSSNGRLEVRDVISTSSTTGAALGQQAGKAFGAHNGRTIKFTAPCDGILMAIYCAIPDIDWTQKGFDRLHSYTTRDKWFTEEFDNGGMQPLFRYQVNYQFGGTPNTNDMRLGYQFAWMEQKVKYSRVCGALSRTKQDWTPQQDDMDITLPSFYINPQYYNGRTAGKGVFAIDYQFNFLTDVTSSSDNLYDKDPLMHELDFNVYKSSKMSTFGLPSL